MKTKHRTLLFTMLLSLCGTTFAEARALKCDAIFQPSVKDVVEEINEGNGRILFKGQSFEDFNQSLSWLRKRKIRKLLQEIEVRSIPSEKALDRYAVELGVALFGEKAIVDRWLFESKAQRLEESTIHIIKEQLLKEGLLKTWGEVYSPAHIGLLKRSLDKFSNFQTSRIGDLLRIPFMLPRMRDQRISKELMLKVLRDGFETHAEEVRIALKHQNKIEAYNTFKRLYAPIFMGTMLVSHMIQAYEELERAQEKNVAQIVNTLREQREAIEANVPLMKQEIIENAYQAAEAEFIQKWGEPPTPEEKIRLKAKIEDVLSSDSK